ncbi:hypothetical protein, partial [Geitlerinema calcuttense]
MDKEFNIQVSDPIFRISCENCGVIADIGEDEEEIRSTAETMGFVAIHSEADGTMNLCKSCYESDPELNPKPTP